MSSRPGDSSPPSGPPSSSGPSSWATCSCPRRPGQRRKRRRLAGALPCRGTTYIQARAPFRPLLQHYVPDDVRTVTGSEQVLGLSDHTYTLPVFEQFLRSVRGADARGTFSWVHVLLPHAPYV